MAIIRDVHFIILKAVFFIKLNFIAYNGLRVGNVALVVSSAFGTARQFGLRAVAGWHVV
jgi:hypothetical protein